jgi:hypothetical protein
VKLEGRSGPVLLRFVLAREPRLLSATLTLFVRALFALQHRRARARGLPTTRGGTSGAVTFVQRTRVVAEPFRQLPGVLRSTQPA